MKASLLLIAVLEYVYAGVYRSPLDHGPKVPEGPVPRLWSLKMRYNPLPEDVNIDFEPPQPWVMKPVGNFSDGYSISMKIRVPNDFFANNEQNVIYACGPNGSQRYFLLQCLEDPTSVFTYHSNSIKKSDDFEHWELDASRRLIGYEDATSVRRPLMKAQ
ncbi:uncharacterized protein LOC141532174 [Cotesia typhae]|uniref:uncharacterized protein LOC141532174 n=1 Tax=Cotesia typhae TaxID=2053667 RepID=UPI003D689AEC